MNTKLGPYNLIGVLGRGGMGVVYKAYETSLNRFVAVKMLAEALLDDESVKERFLREARSMAALNDPHIIQIYFIGDDAGQTYFVMEFVDGESLGSLLKREVKLKPEQAAKIIYQTAQGLTTAHDRGVIHRDIKPGNLMISARGSVKIADFGIALKTQDFSKKLTSTGEFVGTPGYLSPEVCLGKPVDQRSDIFSLGIVLFECVAGRMPFTDESPLGLMLEVVKAEIPDVCTLNAEVDPELSRILGRMIAKDPAERYQSCQELVDDLAKYPLVAKGGPIALQTQPVMLEPLRRTLTNAPIAAISTNPSIAKAATRSAPTARASAIAASQPRLRRASALPTRARSTRYWAAGAALALAAVASAWAFRTDLPFVAPLLGAAVPPPAAVIPPTPGMPTGRTGNALANTDNAATTPAAAARDANPDTSAGPADPALLDAMWLDDVPDAALAAETADDGGTAYRAAAYTAPNYAPAYYAAAPWRIGFGLGIGIGYWATRIAAPVYVGPALQPGFVWSHPLPGTTVVTTVTSPVAVATRTLANIPATATSPSNGFVHNAPNPAALARPAEIQAWRPRSSEQPARGANLARANVRLANQDRLGTASLRLHPAAARVAAVRERAPQRPHPKAGQH